MKGKPFATRVGLATAIVIAGLLLGVLSGHAYRDIRRRAAANEKQRLKQVFLERNMRGIEVGKPFPDIPFQDSDGRPVLARDLLVDGGALVFTASDCESCFKAISALDAAVRATQIDPQKVLLVTAGELPSLMDYMSRESIDLRLVDDAQRSLPDEYGVLTFPCLFTLDSLHIVRSVSAGVLAEEDFISLLQEQ